MREIVFEYPQAVWIMIGVFFIFCLQFYKERNRLKRLQNYASTKLLPYLIVDRSKLINLLKRIAWVIVWILACLALMGPEGNIRYIPLNQSNQASIASDQTHEVIFLVDTSGSMSVPDGSNSQTRLEEAKEIMQDIVTQLQGVNLSVYAFTSELTPVVPPTLDYLFVHIMLRGLHINEGDIGGTLFAQVLEKLKDKILSVPTAYAHTIILFSDGEDNEVYRNRAVSKEKIKSILAAIPKSANFPITFYTVGLGRLKPSLIPKVTTESGKPVESQLEPEILKKIAEASDGKYFTADEWNTWELASALAKEVAQIYTRENGHAKSSRKVKSVSQDEKIADRYFQIPLGFAILLLLLGLFWPDIRKSKNSFQKGHE
jgi:Ca-activated chloride channel family protein